jgi:tRNA C32,U32 (ribose-2'-O)-methylase TrmJ
MLLRLLDIATPILEASGFLEAGVRELNLRRLRRTLLNARLSPEDVELLTQAARKIEYRLARTPRV